MSKKNGMSDLVKVKLKDISNVRHIRAINHDRHTVLMRPSLMEFKIDVLPIFRIPKDDLICPFRSCRAISKASVRRPKNLASSETGPVTSKGSFEKKSCKRSRSNDAGSLIASRAEIGRMANPCSRPQFLSFLLPSGSA